MSVANFDWAEINVGALGAVFTGRTPPTSRADYFGEPYPFITPGDMHQGKYAFKTQRSLSPAGAALLRRIKLPPGSVCVSCIGWQMGEVIITHRDSFSNQQINAIVPSDGYDPAYLYYSFCLRKRELLSLGSAAGVRTPILNKSAFCSLRIKIPPLPTQRRIASILGAYDDLMEVNRRRIVVLEEMARRLFEEWFGQCRLSVPQDTTTVITPQATPPGWTVTTIGAAFKTALGGTPSRKRADYWAGGSIPWINSGKANELRISAPSEWITEQALRESAAKLMPAGAVVVAITGATLGQHSVLLSPMCGNQSLVGIWDVAGERREHLYRYLAAHMRSLTQQASGGAQQHINKEIVDRFPYLCPPETVLAQYNKLALPIGDLIGRLILANDKMAKSRDLLLPRLVSGKVSVKIAERELEVVT